MRWLTFRLAFHIILEFIFGTYIPRRHWIHHTCAMVELPNLACFAPVRLGQLTTRWQRKHRRTGADLRAYYNCDSSTIPVRFERDSSTIRAQHATTRYEVFRALAYEIDSSTPRESVVGVSCMLIDNAEYTIIHWEIIVMLKCDYM